MTRKLQTIHDALGAPIAQIEALESEPPWWAAPPAAIGSQWRLPRGARLRRRGTQVRVELAGALPALRPLSPRATLLAANALASHEVREQWDATLIGVGAAARLFEPCIATISGASERRTQESLRHVDEDEGAWLRALEAHERHWGQPRGRLRQQGTRPGSETPGTLRLDLDHPSPMAHPWALRWRRRAMNGPPSMTQLSQWLCAWARVRHVEAVQRGAAHDDAIECGTEQIEGHGALTMWIAAPNTPALGDRLYRYDNIRHALEPAPRGAARSLFEQACERARVDPRSAAGTIVMEARMERLRSLFGASAPAIAFHDGAAMACAAATCGRTHEIAVTSAWPPPRDAWRELRGDDPDHMRLIGAQIVYANDDGTPD